MYLADLDTEQKTEQAIHTICCCDWILFIHLGVPNNILLQFSWFVENDEKELLFS